MNLKEKNHQENQVTPKIFEKNDVILEEKNGCLEKFSL